MIGLEELNEYFRRGFRLDTLVEVFGYDIAIEERQRDKNSIFMHRPSRVFIYIEKFADFPVNTLVVKECTTQRVFCCPVSEIY